LTRSLPKQIYWLRGAPEDVKINALPSLCCALIAAMLGLSFFAGRALAATQPVEAQANSFQCTVDNFVSYLKSETNKAMIAAARIARKNKDSLAQAESWIGTTAQAALSDQKERLKTLGKDASAMWEDRKETAVSSWAKVERQAHDALDWIAAGMRNESLSDQHPETLV